MLGNYLIGSNLWVSWTAIVSCICILTWKIYHIALGIATLFIYIFFLYLVWKSSLFSLKVNLPLDLRSTFFNTVKLEFYSSHANVCEPWASPLFIFSGWIGHPAGRAAWESSRALRSWCWRLPRVVLSVGSVWGEIRAASDSGALQMLKTEL